MVTNNRTLSRFTIVVMALMGLFLVGCADQQALQQEAAVAEVQRVIVSLETSDTSVADQIEALTKRYPSATVIRVFESFHQVVLDVPKADMKALEQEPEIATIAPDRTHTPSSSQQESN